MKDALSAYHPIVSAVFFMVVTGGTMFLMHPVIVAASLLGAVVYSGLLQGSRQLKKNILWMVPAVMAMGAVNPLFNHQGITVLFYLKNGNPITLESMVFGALSAMQFLAAILWFVCFNQVMTSDKLLYLLGKLHPSFSLILSMTFRFVPRYQAQFKRVSSAQKCIGKHASKGGVWAQVHYGLRVMSIMTTWALENAVDTADSMKARGYGEGKRTHFTLYRQTPRDAVMLTFLLGFSAVLVWGWGQGLLMATCYPAIDFAKADFGASIVWGCWFALSMVPGILNVWEGLQWNFIASKH